MSTPIKPPGGPPGAPPPDGADGPKKSAPTEAFSEVLAAEPTADPARVARAGEVDGVQAISDDLAAGRIDAEAAVERLVQRALSSNAAAALTPERREALEDFLRQSLAHDPSLQALTEELDGG